MAYVTVTLDTSVSPPKFTFKPDPVDINPGTETIHWTRASANFTFAALAIDHPNPFSNVIVHDDELTAYDDNHLVAHHNYNVLVKANGTYYSSKEGHILTGGGPTIRNN